MQRPYRKPAFLEEKEFLAVLVKKQKQTNKTGRTGSQLPAPKHQCKPSAHPTLRQQRVRCKSLACRLEVYNRYLYVYRLSWKSLFSLCHSGNWGKEERQGEGNSGSQTNMRMKVWAEIWAVFADCFYSWLVNASTPFLLLPLPPSFTGIGTF